MTNTSKANGVSDAATDDSGAGLGNPRKPTRFKPKQSGNRKGRKKGAKNRKTVVAEIAAETHRVLENGKRRQRSTLELVALTFRQLCAESNRARVLRAYNEFEAKFGTPEPSQGGGGWLITPEKLSVEEWEARYARPKPDSEFEK